MTLLRLTLVGVVVIVALLAVPSSYAFDVLAETPRSGAVVHVPRGSVAWVHITIRVQPGGCKHDGGYVSSRVGNVQFAPVSGNGRRFFVSLVRASHHIVAQPGPIPYTTATFSIGGYAGIGAPYVSNGELARWRLNVLCVADLGPQFGELVATATGTIRIVEDANAPPTTTAPPPATTARPGGAIPFRVTGIDSPASVSQNGARGTATIHWSGNPRFPVTMHDAPASCPAGFTCHSETKIAARRANPLTWAAWWCSGSVAANWTLDFRFWLTDAAGRHTQKVRKQVTCDVG